MAWPLARAASPTTPSSAAVRRIQPAAGDAAILQAGVVVVDGAQVAQFRLQARALGEHCLRCPRRRRRSRRRRARRGPSGSGGRRVARCRRSRSSFRRENCARPNARPPSLPRKPRSPRWLAMRSRSSSSARSQSARARGPRAGHALERHGIGPGVGHGAVARNAPGEPRALRERHGLEALFDALVLVAETLLQAQHALADDGEAEMARLDGAGVHRADRNLVHAVALDRNEGVAGIARIAGAPARRRRGAADARSRARRRGAASRARRAGCHPRPAPRAPSGRTRRAACARRRGRAATDRDRPVAIRAPAVPARAALRRSRQAACTAEGLPARRARRSPRARRAGRRAARRPLARSQPAAARRSARARRAPRRRSVRAARPCDRRGRQGVHPISLAAWRYQSAR